MFERCLIVLTAPIDILQIHITAILLSVSKVVKQTVDIHLAHGLHDPQGGREAVNKGNVATIQSNIQVSPSTEVKGLVTAVYAAASSVVRHLNVRFLLFNITQGQDVRHELNVLPGQYDVVLYDRMIDLDKVKLYLQTNFDSKSVTGATFQKLNNNELDNYDEAGDLAKNNGSTPVSPMVTCHDNVVLGGTFDRLHNGHKILLSEACLRAKIGITVGVTHGNMNAAKSVCELIEPTDDRIRSVSQFITAVKPVLVQTVVAIEDPYGPSITDPNLSCIVVSEETLRGGHKVNEKRIEKGLSELDVEVVAIISDETHCPEEDPKISSSTARQRLLASLIRKPTLSSSLESSPYIIGLTGGIASGKSSICRRLAKLGAATIDCDKLGHQAYAAGSDTLNELVDAFGATILDPSGEIDRKALGAIVFKSPDKMAELNAIVWPAISRLVTTQIEQYRSDGIPVVVMEAAILLEAKWEVMVHEVWSVIVPKNEAVKRIVSRDHLSDEQALARIESQMTNQERVDKSNVILSTVWDSDITQKYVEKAWFLLNLRLQMTFF